MVTCPYCGTNYATFQPNCKNCGGPLPAVEQMAPAADSTRPLIAPPAAPRPISDRYAWRLMFADGWWIAALVPAILGVVFTLVGAGLSLGGRITSFVGIPFLAIGVPLFLIGAWLFAWRYDRARKVVRVLREGDSARGQIDEVRENYAVTINGRHPWIIRYRFQALGVEYGGTVSTMNKPGPALQEGRQAFILYLADAPKWSSIYPHP